jgi:hypothetical protein
LLFVSVYLTNSRIFHRLAWAGTNSALLVFHLYSVSKVLIHIILSDCFLYNMLTTQEIRQEQLYPACQPIISKYFPGSGTISNPAGSHSSHPPQAGGLRNQKIVAQRTGREPAI